MGYDAWESFSAKDLPATSEFSKEIFTYLKHDCVVLDLGCGYGRLSGLLSEQGYLVYGIDKNPNAIKEAKENPELTDVSFSVQNATKTDFEDRFFNGIILQGVLACMGPNDRQKTLAECHRILRPKAVIQIAEFGQTDNKKKYLEHAQETGEYGTIIIKNPDESDRFQTHNFSKLGLQVLIEEARLEILNYESPTFKTIHGNDHPGHTFLCRKS